MLKRSINFYFAALLITAIGAIGTFAIVDAAATADEEGYGSSHPQQKSGVVPTISEQLKYLAH
jgi:hypothetical protein